MSTECLNINGCSLKKGPNLSKEAEEQNLDIKRITETHLREHYEWKPETRTLIGKGRRNWKKGGRGNNSVNQKLGSSQEQEDIFGIKLEREWERKNNI